MKKIISLTLILILCMSLFSTISSYAASLNTIIVETDKTTVRPGSEIKLTINFGMELREYTFNIAYDNKIFDFVSVDGGTANDTTDKVKVEFDTKTDTNNSRQNMSIIFKAKDDIVSSNPTELTVVGEKMINKDGTISYDDITTPIVKNIIVEPEYMDYDIKLSYTGELVKSVEKDMTLSFSSSMGRFFEKARLIAEAITPEGETVKITGINNEENVKQDIIQSGWGDPQGYKIGGKDFSQVLNLKALFSSEGEYIITLKLIDRDNSDSIISEKQYKFNVLAQATTQPSENTPVGSIENSPANNAQTTNNQTQLPKSLPKTGYNAYIPMGIVIACILGVAAYYNTGNKKQK